MTPQDHNKVIGIMHLIWGGFNGLVMLILVPFIIAIGALGASDPGAPPGIAAIFGIIGVVILALTLVLCVPPVIAGYAMLKRKRWAKVWGIIAACVESLSMPFGTALCVYTLWFLFGPGQNFHRGEEAHSQQEWLGSLHRGSPYDWESQRDSRSSRPREYVPPRQPPDWRG